MNRMKLTAIVIMGLLLTAACHKNEEDTSIDPCMNGQLDAGETAIDCGGSCGACPPTEVPTAGFKIGGVAVSASTKTLTYNNGWSLHLETDSVTLQLNLGNDGSVGTYVMSPGGSYASVQGLNYPMLASGSFSISSHDATAQKMNGFFQGKFVRIPGDTVFITNGYFTHLAY